MVTVFSLNVQAGEVRGRIKVVTARSGKGGGADKHTRAVAYLTGKGLDGVAAPEATAVVVQKSKSFQPRVMAVTQGQEVTFKNEDPVFHNVWSLSKAGPFDLGSFRAPEQKKVKFDKPGLIKTFCNIHPEMIGSVLVLKNRFHSTTDKQGNYKISGIPPGDYTLRVWAEGASPLKKAITVTVDSKETMHWEVQGEQRSEKHLDKNGKAYKTY